MPDCSRRLVMSVLGVLGIGAVAPRARADDNRTAWDFGFPSLEGGDLPLAQFKGRALLVVNTASFCGYTYQYKALEALHAAQNARGLTVIGVPSTDFYQESTENDRVRQFCDKTFGVKFPMAAISHVRDSKAAPFYAWVRATRNWQPTWNFNKVLIGRDGTIKGLYRATTEPDGPVLTAAIATELAKASSGA